MKKIILILVIFVSSVSQAALVPEDGSAPVRGWVHSQWTNKMRRQEVKFPAISDFSALQAAFEFEGLELKTLEVGYHHRSWIQDHFLFNHQGKVLKMAQIRYKILEDHAPSSSTFYSMEDADEYDPSWIEEISKTLATQTRQFKYTRVEGGELITGIKKDKPYAIIKEDAVWRTAKQFKVNFNEAKVLVASDFEILPEHLYVIEEQDNEMPVHIDTFMMALPKGKILIDDDMLFSGVASYLEENGFYVFKTNGRFGDDTNFFNGFVVQSPRDQETVVFTNKSNSESRNTMWRYFLDRHGVSRVYFLGQWRPNAGIDCAGVLF